MNGPHWQDKKYKECSEADKARHRAVETIAEGMRALTESKRIIILKKTHGRPEAIALRHDLAQPTIIPGVFVAPEVGMRGLWFFIYEHNPVSPDESKLMGYIDDHLVEIWSDQRMIRKFGSYNLDRLKDDLRKRFIQKEEHDPSVMEKISVPRASVADFAERMETTLSRHDEKKGGQKEWRKLRITEALAELEIEVAELRAAVVKCDDENTAHECIDVANRCMMLHDLVVKLREDYE
jgi:hypothetical protein